MRTVQPQEGKVTRREMRGRGKRRATDNKKKSDGERKREEAGVETDVREGKTD